MGDNVKREGGEGSRSIFRPSANPDGSYPVFLGERYGYYWSFYSLGLGKVRIGVGDATVSELMAREMAT